MSQSGQQRATRDQDAFTRRVGVCYRDEQGKGYEYADILTACNGDEAIAERLFPLCYWQSPRFHFLIGEELPVARLTHHNDRAIRWLQFEGAPSQAQTQTLTQNCWTALNFTMRVWEGEQANVPSGIAYRNHGARDHSPLEEGARHEQYLADLRARSDNSQPLTPAAQARHARFLSDLEKENDRLRKGPTYILLQLPARPETLLPIAEDDARLHLHAGYSKDAEELYQALDRLEANCVFIITEYKDGKSICQVKGTRDRGTIRNVCSREPESDLHPIVMQLAERINAEPARERLIRRWKDAQAARRESIEFEMHNIEWLPLMRKIYRRDSLEHREQDTTNAAETLLRLEGWQSAYAFALEIAPVIPDAVDIPDAQAFLAELTEQQERAKAAQNQAKLDSLYHIIETGRMQGFHMLIEDATKFLLPLEFQSESTF